MTTTTSTALEALAELGRKARERAEELTRARAELKVLEAFDDCRAAVGHDYGNGQRHGELLRRRREVRELTEAVDLRGGDSSLCEPSREQLAEAFKRTMLPRARRANREVDSEGRRFEGGDRVLRAIACVKVELDLLRV